jgi:amino acid transporter
VSNGRVTPVAPSCTHDTAFHTIRGQFIAGGNDDDPAVMQARLEDSPMLQQSMKPRHLQMIAVGGSIGTGLFIGSGSALATGGPGGILIAWIL